MKNIVIIILIILFHSSCKENEEFTIKCSEDKVFYIDSDIKFVSQAQLQINKICCDSISMVLVDYVDGNLNNEEEIINFAKDSYNKIYFFKDQTYYQGDWYSNKYAVVVLSNSQTCNQETKLQVKTMR
jgi:hypothetical protein